MSASWVIVTGDVVRHGGMDRANFELATWLANQGRRVDLVAHRFEPGLASHPNVVTHQVPRPLGVHLFAGALLDREGQRVARERVGADPATRVIVNGGNCRWFDANWVHAVHHAWDVRDEGAPLSFRAKNRVVKWRARADERKVLAGARVVLANSEKTRGELVNHLGLDERRVKVVYLGCDPAVDRPSLRPAIEEQRARLGVGSSELLALFVGALGRDRNKGLDTLLDAWGRLGREAPGGTFGKLFVAGAGASAVWEREIAARGLAGSVRILGFRRDASELLGAADVVIAPSRYDSYGLAVQEALCRHVPVLVSSRAGIAERYPTSLAPLVLPDPENAADVATRISHWRGARERYAPEVAKLGDSLRAHSWSAMAAEMVAAIEQVDVRARALT